MTNARAYSAASATAPLLPTTIDRRELLEGDVQMDILFCGICHSDLHHVRDEFGEFMRTVSCREHVIYCKLGYQYMRKRM